MSTSVRLVRRFKLKNKVMEDNREQNDMEMDESMHGVPRKEVPEVAKEEPDDKPAARTIQWTIIIAVVILAIIYFVFLY